MGDVTPDLAAKFEGEIGEEREALEWGHCCCWEGYAGNRDFVDGVGCWFLHFDARGEGRNTF